MNDDEKRSCSRTPHQRRCRRKRSRSSFVAQTFSEKERVVDEFAKFSKDLNQIYDQLGGTRLLGDENSEDTDPDNPEIPRLLSNLLKLLYMERDRLSKTMKALKKEKAAMSGKKKPKIRSVRVKRKGWIPE